jgi:hypothetical protein
MHPAPTAERAHIRRAELLREAVEVRLWKAPSTKGRAKPKLSTRRFRSVGPPKQGS